MLPNAGSWTKTDESKLKDVFSLNEMIHGVLGTLFTPFFIQFTSLLTLNLEKPNYWIQWIVSNTIKYTNLSISLSLTHFVFQWIIIWYIQIECRLSSGNDTKSVLDPIVSMLSVQCSMFLILHDWIISQTCFLFNAKTHSRFVYFAFVFVVIITVCRYGCCFIAHKALTDLFTKWKHSMDTSNRKLNRFSPISCENFLIVYLSLCFFFLVLSVWYLLWPHANVSVAWMCFFLSLSSPPGARYNRDPKRDIQQF